MHASALSAVLLAFGLAGPIGAAGASPVLHPGRAPALDSVRVWATLTAEQIQVGSTTILEINVETSGSRPDEIQIPALPRELEILSSSDFSQARFSLPGGRSRLVRREIVLRARAPGEYVIPPISARVRGARYQTRPLTLNVVAGPQPGTGTGVRGPDDEIIFNAELLVDTAYVGQRVTLRSDVMISDEARIRLRRAPEYLPPDVSGFWTYDVPRSSASVTRTIGPRRYQVQTFARLYYPLTPGEYTLPPARLTYEIRRGFTYSPQLEELVSDSLRLVVLPLPAEGRPDGFTGAVGRFEVRARIEPSEIPAGEAVALTVEVEGEGNIRALPPPELPEIPGVEVHPPTEDARAGALGGTLSGVKRFTWVLIAHEPGRFEFPPIEYAYFDPERGAYEVARSAPMELAVVGDAAPSPVSDVAVRDRSIRTEPSGDARIRWVRSPVFAAVQFVPLLAILGVLLWRRRSSRPAVPSRHALRRERDRALAGLRARATHPDDAWFRELAELIASTVRELVDEPGLRASASRTMAEAIAARGVDPGVASGIAALLDRLERARFAPEPPGPDTCAEMVETAARLLDTLERQTRRGGRRGRAKATASTAGTGALAGIVAGAAFLTALLAGSARVATAQASPEQPFQVGVERYEAEDYTGAARAFSEFLRAHPYDANAWYNLGGAYFEDGERGRAVWAWLQALRLRPRDAALRANLAAANADPHLLRLAAPVGPLAPDETLLLAALAWFAGAAGVIRFILSRRRHDAVLGAGAIVVAILIVGAWSAPRLRAAVGIVLPAETALRGAPSPRADAVAEIRGGAGVRIVDRREGWLRVRSLDGAEGWLETSQVGALRATAGEGATARRPRYGRRSPRRSRETGGRRRFARARCASRRTRPPHRPDCLAGPTPS